MRRRFWLRLCTSSLSVAGRTVPVSQYDILKTLFLADRAHLNKYGRPITFDNYVAMRAGPVPSRAYNLLKATSIRKKPLPWDKAQVPGGKVYYSNPGHTTFADVLSESDRDALQEAYDVVKNLTFQQIRRLTHSDPAYVEAWKDDEDRKAFNMKIGMLFDSPNFEQAEAVEFLSKHM